VERVFYFSGHRMRVFEWEQRELLGTHEFEPDEAGFAAFEYFLDDAIGIPARLLVDMIEEDFRREDIPHVNSRDRKSLVQRLVERHYREEDFVHAQLVGRSSVGRRDDQVLLSALTSIEVLTPWLDLMEEHKVRLAGIWSLPLISAKLLKPVHTGEVNSLLVTRQIRSSLRNTYFRKGKLLLSRQARFDKIIWEDDSTEIVVEHIERGAKEIYNFLINQRILGDGEHLQVHCILPETTLDEARDLAEDGAGIRYDFTSTESLFKRFKLKGLEGQGADALFSWLCSKESILRDHYASREQKSTFTHYLVDRIVTQAEELGTLFFVTAAVLLALNSMELGQEIKNLDFESQRMAVEYEQVFGGIDQQLNTADRLRETVRLVRELQGQATQAPQAFFEPLGRVLGDPRFAAIQLNRLDWHKQSIYEARQALESHRLQTRAEENPYQSEYATDYEYYEEAEENPRERAAVLQLRGRIDMEGLSYSATVDRMREMTRRLGELPGVSDVLLVRTPVDVRARARFSDQVGRDQERDPSDEDYNSFEMLIVLEEEERV